MEKSFAREPINTYTHLSAAVLSLIGTIILFIVGNNNDSLTTLSVVSILAFGLSLIALYTASGIYHMLYVSDEMLLRLKKLDHAMIFVLIAGSYTPFCLLALNGAWQWGLMSVIWALAIIGIILKVCWINMPRWLSTGMYIGMGWISVVAVKPLYATLSSEAFFFLLLGGIVYTIGGIIYGLKKPNISKHFGFHEIFHVFIMLGSFCHYWAVVRYII